MVRSDCLWPMMRSNCCGQWCVAIVVGGVCRRLQWAVDGDMANLVGRVSHATFCGTARPLTHDHHSRAPPMFPDSPVMFPDTFATLSWPRIES